MRKEIQDFKNIIEGQDVFIIGGGPSLKNFDFNKLDGKIKIALNNSFETTNPTAIFWVDKDWAANNYDAVENFSGFKFTTKLNASGYVNKNHKGICNSTVLNKLGDYGFSHDIDNVYGNNSGAQVLNFICNLKPHRIFLLGYDMSFDKGNSHWHKGYLISDYSVYEKLFIPSINAMVNDIKKLNIEIINCNKNSKLNCFKKDDIEKYL